MNMIMCKSEKLFIGTAEEEHLVFQALIATPSLAVSCDDHVLFQHIQPFCVFAGSQKGCLLQVPSFSCCFTELW